jgi:hypothetical protein
MTLQRRVLWATVLGLFLLAVVPAFLLSTPMMEYYQQRIDRDPMPESSRRFQLSVADWCDRTWRPERAATGYRLFYERYRQDVRRAHALLRYAQTLEAAGRTADATDIYQKYLAEYPDLEGKREAELGVSRIHNCRP